MRPTIALACILKDEVKNLPQLLASVKDCFDEIHLTDTGSTDGSIELIEGWTKGGNPANSRVFLHHFTWVNDFAAARSASFAPVKTDYVMWLDLDDVLVDRENFIEWRNNVMKYADFWVATYHYAHNDKGEPACSFARERVFRNNLGLTWNYFVHEGVIPKSDKRAVSCQYAVTWNVTHKRTQEDVEKDRSRNLKMFESRLEFLDSRMRYYYGKELFENQKPKEALDELLKAVSDKELQAHDRVMGIQYACMAAMQLNQFETAIQLAHQGLQLDPQRAEFFVITGDCYLRMGRIMESVPYFKAASGCPYRGDNAVQGPIFSHKDSYKHYPLNQMAKAYANGGLIEEAEKAAFEATTLGPNSESEGILKEIRMIKEKAGLSAVTIVEKKKSDAIVISCHPTGFYEWDEDVYQSKGIGGSETAVVEMASWIAKKTDRQVLVFNNRDKTKTFGKVEYRPAAELPKYMQENLPKAHIAWRHNVKLTDAPTYLWCHDLTAQGIENAKNYEKVICLSNFHEKFVQNMYGVPRDKTWVSRNGIKPDRFLGKRPQKVEGKVIFSSSPDRGLDRALKVMDKVVKEIPGAKLSCYYGFDNMIKAGKQAEVSKLWKLIEERPYVQFFGNVPQTELATAMMESQVWLYPTDFLETYCITAKEAICSMAYPVVRKWGALEDTLAREAKSGMADVIDSDCVEESEVDLYASAVINAIKEEKWRRIVPEISSISWESVADEWINYMGL